MKTYLWMILLSLPAAEASARWNCELECKRSVDTVFFTIDRHAAGTAYSDFNAECTNVGGVSTWPGESGCAYVYCKKFSTTIDVLTGEGESLSDARESARAKCPEGGTMSCGIMNFNEIGNYNCSQK